MQNFHSFSDNLKVTQVHDPAVTNADADGTAVDMKGYGAVAFYVLVGESADTLNGTNYIELEIEESDDNSTFTDAANADLADYVTGNNTGTFAKIDAATEDDAVYLGQYIGSARYVRPVLNFSGTHTTGTPIGVIAVRTRAQVSPVS